MSGFRLFATILVTAILLFSSAALAADTEKDLKNAAKKIDKAAVSPEGAEKVVQNLSEKFKVPESTIHDLRAQKLGFGEISILLALSQATGKSTSELLQKFKGGEGWGKIAMDEGVKLGPVISEVERVHPSFEQAGSRERGQRPEVQRPELPGGFPGAGPGGPEGRGMGRGRR